MTQRDRVLRQARKPQGVCEHDFKLPNVVDGGEPIYRVNARLFELKRAGHVFEELPRRHGCVVHRLVASSVERDGSRRAPIAHAPDGSCGATFEPSSSATSSAVSLDAQRPSTILSEQPIPGSSLGRQDGALQLFEAPDSEPAPVNAILGEAA